MSIRVSGLFFYPIKSTAGTSVDALALDEFGAVHDRRWMLIDAHGRVITQRETGVLALIAAQISESGLRLTHPHQDPLDVVMPNRDVPAQTVVLWDDDVLVQDAGNAAADWCSAATGVRCRLVHIARDSARPLQHKYAGSVNPDGRHVALSDGAPLLLLSEASLMTLNERLALKNVAPVGFDRFRPNVVFAGAESHAEDTWHSIEINGITIGVGSPCPRCAIPTIDQSVGARSPKKAGEPGGEPLRSLAAYRRQGTGVMFGMNATNATAGVIRVGDEVIVRALR